jgi:hypothetical protein
MRIYSTPFEGENNKERSEQMNDIITWLVTLVFENPVESLIVMAVISAIIGKPTRKRFN